MSDGPLDTIGKTMGELLMQMLSLIGLGLGGGQAAAAADLNAIQQDAFNLLPNRVLTPQTLAELVVKGAIQQGEGEGEATYSGINGSRFDALVRGTGNPPGPETVLTMVRRGILSVDAAMTAFRQGYLKTEYGETFLQMLYDLPNVSQLVEGVVQNHFDEGEAFDLARQQGVEQRDMRLYIDNAGNPPGPMEMLNLWVRGYISEADVDQGLRESRLKNKWIPALKKLAIRKVPMRTITTLLSHGAIDDARALAMLAELGYSPEDAAAIVMAGHKTTTTTHKVASATQIRQLYADQIIPRDQAVQEMAALGYEAAVASELLDLADAEADRKLRTATISKLHSLFVAHHLDVATVSNRLDGLLVPSTQRDRMIALWSLEEEANVHELTPAQVVAATKKGIIDPPTMLERLVRYGYTEEDAITLGMLGGAIAIPQTGQ